MPSVDDLAQCAKGDDGTTPGCDGGSFLGIWDNYLAKSSRRIWSQDAQCKPYTLKCWQAEPGAVVNTLTTGGACSMHSALPTWLRPCSCISSSLLPTKYVCPSGSPTSGTTCAVPLPAAAFYVSNIGMGLSNKDAVLNMQRHIQEFGPIYVSYQCTQAFMDWDWSKKPVYTGCSSNCNPGGHAVIAVGWGTLQSTDYWILRNSWGPEYADKGYFKFQRGINLDGIEAGWNMAAVMPTDKYADWSAPVCDLTSWTTRWTTDSSGVYLKSHTMDLHISCNKQASLKVWTSDRITARGESASGIYSNKKNLPGNTDWVLTVDIYQRWFGLKTGLMWLNIEATDSAGNTATVDRYPSIPAVSGCTKFWSS